MTHDQLQLAAALARGAYATALVLLNEGVDPRGIVAKDRSTEGRGCWEALTEGFDEYKNFPAVLPDVLQALARRPPALGPNDTTVDVVRLFVYDDPQDAGAEATIDFALIQPFIVSGPEGDWEAVLPRLGAWEPLFRRQLRHLAAEAARSAVHTRPSHRPGL